MQRFKVNDVQRFSSDKMQKLNLFETPRFFCDVYCLAPGQEQKPHEHADADKVYYVLEGTAQLRIGEETAPAGAGEIVLAPAGVVHGVHNDSDENVRLLVWMAPHPNRGPGGRGPGQDLSQA
ncbi:MAG: cupin domain-containing protein [Candidatus Xenobia bacterium]